MAEKLKLKIAAMQTRINELEAKLAALEAAPTLPPKPAKKSKPVEMTTARKRRRSKN